MVNFNETVGVKLTSMIGATSAFGHKSAMDLAGASYDAWTFSTASACRDTSQASNAANTKIILDTFFSDMEKRGFIIKA